MAGKGSYGVKSAVTETELGQSLWRTREKGASKVEKSHKQGATLTETGYRQGRLERYQNYEQASSAYV